MISLEDVLYSEPEYVTYSYEEGISNMLPIITVASIFAFISMIMSFIIGVRKKDCVAVLVTNIMVKTVIIFLYQMLYNLLVLDSPFIAILFFIATVVIEGFIYKKVLKYKKNNGIVVSTVCNFGIIFIFTLFSSGFIKLLRELL